jgi:membrane-bound inhibitor of C-type lysozyme
LQARYSSDSVALRLPDGSATLPIALSGSGSRYANDSLEFWEHAGTARLTRRGKIIHDRCRPDK